MEETMKKIMLLLAGTLLSLTSHAGSSTKAYTPGLGEYMMTNQAHHAKLWFAGTNKNWELADYELDEIEETLEDIVKYQPNFDKKPIAKLIPTYTNKPIEDLRLAIKDKNVEQFTKAYDGLTNACNACHQVTNHAFIQLQRPTSPAYTNQKY
jgi:hypothetical protein